jgi:hypothetical protein
MLCKNCKHPINGNYCCNCGEKAVQKRFTLKGILYDHIVLPFAENKKSLPKTIKLLSIRPGSSIREYLEGNRASLYASDKFLLLVGTITTLLTFRYHFFASEFTSTDTPANHAALTFLGLLDKKEFLNQFFLYAEQYATLLNIIAIPVFAIFSYLFFRKKGYTFGENLILNTYITAQQLFCLLLLVPFLEIFPDSKYVLISVYSLFIALYNALVYVQFFKAVTIGGIVKSFVIVAFAYAVQFFFNLAIYYAFGMYFRVLDELKLL